MEGRATEVRSIVIELLTQLRMALGQLRLYPATSPQAQKALLPAHSLVATFPSGQQGKIVLARTLRGFLVNSKRLPASDATALMESFWLQIFQDAHVNSIVLQTSVTLEELTEFMDGLTRRFWDLKDGKAINSRLRDARCLHAWVEEVQFVAMAKGDLLIEGAANKLAAAGARVAEIVETLEGVIDGTSDEGIAEQVRLEIMRKLIEQDPTLIAKAQAMAFAVSEDEQDPEGSMAMAIGTGGGGGGGGGGDGSGGTGGGGTGTGGGIGDGTGTGTGSGTGSGSGEGTGSGTGTGTGGGGGSGSGTGSGTWGGGAGGSGFGTGTGSGSGSGSGSGGGDGSGSGGGSGFAGGSGGGGGYTGSGPRPGRKTLFGTGKSPGWISFNQTRKTLAEIGRMLKDAKTDEEKASLRSFANVLLGGFKYDPLLLALLRQFLSDESLDLMPAWMIEEKKEEKQEPAKDEKPPEPEGPPPAPERARGMLALAEEQRIETLWESGVELIKELITLKAFDSVLDLVKCIVEHVSSIAPHHRLKGAKLISLLYPLFRIDELQEARSIIEGRLLAAVMLERDRTVYPVLVELAADSIESLLVHSQLEQAAPLLESLRNEMIGENKDYPERREISAKGLEKVVAGRGFPIILDKIRTKVNIATRMVEWIGVPAARGVIERMRTSDSVAERMDLAQLLLRAGPDAGALLAEEALNVKAPSEALKLLDLIPHAMNETQAEASLGTLLRHPALAVRRRAASFLGGRGYPRAGGHLVEALRKETDPSARGLFVETLGMLKYEAGLTTLGQILDSRSETDDVRCLAAAALGSLAKPQALPVLTRAAAKGKGFTLVLNAAPTSVRAAAVRALGHYSRYPEGREAIRRSLEDPDAPVRDAAREALLTPMIKAFGDGVKKAAFLTDVQQMATFSDGGITGLLSEVPLDQICQVLDEEGRTGLLMVHVGGSNAEVYIEKGDVVSAEYNGLRGKPAFVQFCRWEGTYFLFLPGIKPQRPGPPTSLMRLLLEACDVEGNTTIRRRPEKRK